MPTIRRWQGQTSFLSMWEPEATLQKLDPLWGWLISHRKGLLKADGEGYYDHSGLMLKVE